MLKVMILGTLLSLNFFNAFSNELRKIFHHLSENESKISLYFKNDPKLKFIAQKCDKKKYFCKQVFIIQDCAISNNNETQKMLKSLKSFKHPFYDFSIAKYLDGIKLSFKFDSRFVKKIEPLCFDSISLFKGITFNVVHDNLRPFLKKIHLPFGKIIDHKKPNVIIDIGHGGSDSGAIGTNKKSEKEITFEVGMKLKKLLETHGYNVFLTRTKDEFVPLDKRTSMSNFLNGKSVFVSIHANYSKNANAKGLETYYADSSLLKKLVFNNQSCIKAPYINKISDQKNYEFAKIIHNTLIDELKMENPELVDRKLNKSISQILLGCQMPIALIELGFLSNKGECQLLSNNEYQQIIAQGIAKAIDEYFMIYC